MDFTLDRLDIQVFQPDTNPTQKRLPFVAQVSLKKCVSTSLRRTKVPAELGEKMVVIHTSQLDGPSRPEVVGISIWLWLSKPFWDPILVGR